MDYTGFGPFRRSSQILHTNIRSQGKEIPQPKVYNRVEDFGSYNFERWKEYLKDGQSSLLYFQAL
ncbi:hypothetical protein LguiA_015375 [Lonicera macranthoides]